MQTGQNRCVPLKVGTPCRENSSPPACGSAAQATALTVRAAATLGLIVNAALRKPGRP